METIKHEPEMVKGFEILKFLDVEIEKNKMDGSHTFTTLGDLNIFYFDYYDKFILQLNNWRYALIPRLPAVGFNENMTLSYQLPAYDGTYTLKLGTEHSEILLRNFETILQNTTKYTNGSRQNVLVEQNEFGGRQLGQGQGPFVEQVQIDLVESKEVPYYEVRGGSAQKVEVREHVVIEKPVENVGTVSAPAGNSYAVGLHGEERRFYERTGQVVNLGNGSYSLHPSNRKRDKVKLKLKKMMGKKERPTAKWNPNLHEIRDFESIKRTDETMVQIHEFKRQELEAVIISAKEIARKLEHPMTEELKEKAVGIFETVKEGAEQLKERFFGDKTQEEKEEEEKQPGMIDIMKEGFYEIKDKIAHRGEMDAGVGGMARNAILVNSIYQSMKDVAHKIKETQKEKPHKMRLPDTIALEAEEFDQREHPGLTQIIKEGYSEVKEKIAHRDEITHGDRGSLEKAYVAATVFDGVKDVTCKLFREGKYEIKEKMTCFTHKKEEDKLKIFDNKYLDQPYATIGIIPPIATTTETNLYKVPVIPATTRYPEITSSYKYVTTPPVKVISQTLPSTGTADKVLTSRFDEHLDYGVNRKIEETIHNEVIVKPLESEYVLNPANQSFMDKIKASIPFLHKKEAQAERGDVVIQEVDEIEITTNKNEHPGLMESVKNFIGGVGERLSTGLCSQNLDNLDQGERFSCTNQVANASRIIKDTIENTAVQIPEYEPELYMTPEEALAREALANQQVVMNGVMGNPQVVNPENDLVVQTRSVETLRAPQQEEGVLARTLRRDTPDEEPLTMEQYKQRYLSNYYESQGLGTRIIEVRRIDRSSQNLNRSSQNLNRSEALEEGMLHYA